MASEIQDGENGASVRAKLNVLLQFRADTSNAGIGIDSAAYLQGLFNLAGSLATGNSRAIVMIDAHFYGSEMLTVPNLVDVEMTANGAYDVSGTAMMTGFFALNTVGTRMQNVRVIGSGQGSQPANTLGPPSASQVRLSGSGIIFAGVLGGVISNCRIENCGGTTGVLPYNGVAGIWITYGCKDCLVEGNRVDTCRNGINQDNYFQAAPYGNKIISNWVRGGRFGIADDCAADATDTLISVNSIKNCQQSGIDLNKSNRLICANNYIENCGLQNGNESIWAYGTSGIPGMHIIISGNLIKGGVGTGVKMGPNVFYSQVNGNNIESPGQHGIHIIGPCRHWNVADNTITDPANEGVLVFKDGANLVTTGNLIGNYVFQSGWNGFNLDGAQELTAIGNTSKSASQSAVNTYDGFRLNNGVILSSFQGNHSSGGTQRYALAGVDANTLGNTFVGNTLIAGATGRIAFANLLQNWGENGDGYITVAGAPTGTYPYGARVYNNGDQKLYINGSGGWRSVTTV